MGNLRSTCSVVLLAASACFTGLAQHTTRRTSSVKTNSAASAPSAVRNIFWEPNTVLQGSPAFFTVELEKPATRVTGTLLGKKLTFFREPDTNLWHALAGDDLETQPGSYDLQITAVLAGGRIAQSSKAVDVTAANFQTGSVDVPENYVEPDALGKKQIASDELAKAHAYAHLTATPQWSGNFIEPVKAAANPSFGESRILNEEKSSLHRGTDYPVNVGTSVVAANSGTVVLAKELFYEGNCVIIDHGQQFFTIYMHLSKIDVSVGDKVAKGAKLGASGETGRVTGPHVHIGVRWNGAYLDPVELFKLTLPKTAAAESARSGRRAAAAKRAIRR